MWHFVAPEGTSLQEVRMVLFRTLVPALFGHCPHQYPEHRWTGVDITLRDLGLPACLHGLGGFAYSEMMRLSFSTEAEGHQQHQAGAEGEDAGELGPDEAPMEIIPLPAVPEAAAPPQEPQRAPDNPHIAGPEECGGILHGRVGGSCPQVLFRPSFSPGFRSPSVRATSFPA